MLFCAGITVFTPLVEFGVKPTDQVGVVGIGGLGHLALQFLNRWGCEVWALTSTNSKRDEALKLGNLPSTRQNAGFGVLANTPGAISRLTAFMRLQAGHHPRCFQKGF